MDSVNIFSNNRQIINKNTKFAGDSIPNNVVFNVLAIQSIVFPVVGNIPITLTF